MNHLRRMRIKLGVTQAELSKRTKIIYSTVSRLENEIIAPTPQQKRKIARFFRCKIQDIFPANSPSEKDLSK